MNNTSKATPLATVNNLTLSFRLREGSMTALSDIRLSIAPKEIVGLVGESGCGKSTLANALIGQLPGNGQVDTGTIHFDGRSILGMDMEELSSLRGRRIAFVPQSPPASLSPGMRVGSQIVEMLKRHDWGDSKEARVARVTSMFAQVGLPSPETIGRRYPHELSGGQQQRVCIALALSCDPDLMVLDEPTTGLDVTTQSQIADLLRRLRDESGASMLYVTHDLALLSEIADRVVVMYAGKIVEEASISELFDSPRHPYTRALIAASPDVYADRRSDISMSGVLRRSELPPVGCNFEPRCPHAEARCRTTTPALSAVTSSHHVACLRWQDIGQGSTVPVARAVPSASKGNATLLEIEDLAISYQRPMPFPLSRLPKRPAKMVVSDISLTVREGETLALVGESGSGKTTIARAVAGLLPAAHGVIRFRGSPLGARVKERTAADKRAIQYIFQNPDATLNPRESIERILRRPLEILAPECMAGAGPLIQQVLGLVQLEAAYAKRRPGSLSGGERQRIAIGRALIVAPELLICDEILSALDVSVQAKLIELLLRLKREEGVASVFISHDLAVVREISDSIAVLFHGELVEVGTAKALFAAPYHPYTASLLLAAPSISRRARATSFLSSSPVKRSVSGCRYKSRCRWAIPGVCDVARPPLVERAPGLKMRCHLDNDALARIANDVTQPGAARSS